MHSERLDEILIYEQRQKLQDIVAIVCQLSNLLLLLVLVGLLFLVIELNNAVNVH